MRDTRISIGIAAVLVAVATFVMAGSTAMQVPQQVQLEVVAIADSGNHYVYRYVATNPPSPAGIGSFEIDISSAPNVQFDDPPPTGRQFSSLTPGDGRVPLGTITPPGWESIVRKHWSVGDTSAAFTTIDSIAPGTSLTGLGARSQFLPGIRTTWTLPTIQACCNTPLEECDTITNEFCQYPFPSAFEIEGTAVGPTYEPGSFTIGLLEHLRARSCQELTSITDPGVCGGLEDVLAAAESALAAGEIAIARSELDAFMTQLHANHDTAGTLPIDDNAYWMLLTNARHIRFKTLPAPVCGEPRELAFLAGQSTEAGTVTTWNDASNIYVKYSMASGWQVAESHVAVALSINGLPTNNAGNPMAGQFPHAADHGSGAAEYTYTIPLVAVGAGANTELLIAAHGAVTGPAGSETAWAEGSRFTDQGNWAMYFTFVVTNCE